MTAVIFVVALFAVFVTLLYAMLAAASKTDRQSEEYYRSKLLTEEVTPVPEISEPWIRYDVKLDDELQKHIERLCDEYEVPAAIIMAIIETESKCDPDAVSEDGKDFGLMQIRETMHHDRCVRLGADNLFSPYQNVLVGIDYFAELMNCGHGVEWALSWYNGHSGEPCEYAYMVQIRAETLLESAQLVDE